MTRTAHGIARYLELLHETPEFTGLADFHARYRRVLPAIRTIYRWQRQHPVRHHPNVRFHAFGLVRCHIITAKETAQWLATPYAISAHWARDGLGARILYLECLVPKQHMAGFRDEVRSRGATLFTTDDPWQVFQLTRRTLSTPVPELEPLEHVQETFPFVLPVSVETATGARSLDELWRGIYDRLGDRVWQYLPRGMRRLPHNGKRYVRMALSRLSSAGLVRQNIIRYESLDHLELLVTARLSDDQRAEWLERLRQTAPSVEVYTGTPTLLRITASITTLRELITLTEATPAHLYLLTESIPVRFRYEQLFNPTTKEWQEDP